MSFRVLSTLSFLTPNNARVWQASARTDGSRSNRTAHRRSEMRLSEMIPMQPKAKMKGRETMSFSALVLILLPYIFKTSGFDKEVVFNATDLL